VTLSTGALVFAGGALGAESFELGAVSAACGIAAIGALNFGVSFALALLVALRARDVTRLERMQLLRAIAARVRTHPREFLLPP
jgi:site-specific recombinase